MVKSILELKRLVSDIVMKKETEFTTRDVIQDLCKINTKASITAPRISNWIKTDVKFCKEKRKWIPNTNVIVGGKKWDMEKQIKKL